MSEALKNCGKCNRIATKSQGNDGKWYISCINTGCLNTSVGNTWAECYNNWQTGVYLPSEWDDADDDDYSIYG